MIATGALEGVTWWLAAAVAALALVELVRFGHTARAQLPHPTAEPAGFGMDPDATWTVMELGPIGRLISGRLRSRAFQAPVAALAAVLPLAAVLALLPRLDPVWLLAATAWYVLLASFAGKPPLTGALDWVVPVVFRLAEYAVVVVGTAVLVPRALPLAVAHVAVASLRLTVLTHELARGATPSRPAHGGAAIARRVARGIAGGQDGRLLVFTFLMAAATSGLSGTFYAPEPDAVAIGLGVMTALLTLVLVTEGIAEWIIRPAAGTILRDHAENAERTGDEH